MSRDGLTFVSKPIRRTLFPWIANFMYDGCSENHSKQAKPSWEIFSVSPQNRIVEVVLFVLRAVPLPLHTPWHLCRPFLLKLINASHIHVGIPFRRKFWNSLKFKHFFLKWVTMVSGWGMLVWWQIMQYCCWRLDLQNVYLLKSINHGTVTKFVTSNKSFEPNSVLFGGFICLILVLIFCPDTIGRNILLLTA